MGSIENANLTLSANPLRHHASVLPGMMMPGTMTKALAIAGRMAEMSEFGQ
jgi:hypothetical protein